MTPTPTAAARVSGTDIDRAMLQSMATSLRSGMDFSFNRHDMAELLDRLAAIQPDPEPQPVAWRYRSLVKPTCWSNVTEYRRTAYARIGMEEQPLYATPSSAGTVSVEAAVAVIEDHFAGTIYASNRTKAFTALRALAGDMQNQS